MPVATANTALTSADAVAGGSRQKSSTLCLVFTQTGAHVRRAHASCCPASRPRPRTRGHRENPRDSRARPVGGLRAGRAALGQKSFPRAGPGRALWLESQVAPSREWRGLNLCPCALALGYTESTRTRAAGLAHSEVHPADSAPQGPPTCPAPTRQHWRRELIEMADGGDTVNRLVCSGKSL